MENGTLPAFSCHENTNPKGESSGLSKREYFAGLAMQGWIACQHEGFTAGSNESIAERAVACADELLKALEAKL